MGSAVALGEHRARGARIGLVLAARACTRPPRVAVAVRVVDVEQPARLRSRARTPSTAGPARCRTDLVADVQERRAELLAAAHDADRAALLDDEHARLVAGRRGHVQRLVERADLLQPHGALGLRRRGHGAAAARRRSRRAGARRRPAAASRRLEQRSQALGDALQEAHVGLPEVRPRLARQAAQHVGPRVLGLERDADVGADRAVADAVELVQRGLERRVGHDRADPPVQQPLADRVAQRHGEPDVAASPAPQRTCSCPARISDSSAASASSSRQASASCARTWPSRSGRAGRGPAGGSVRRSTGTA